MKKRSDILLESTVVNTIRDAALVRHLLIACPEFGHIGAEYHDVQIGKSLPQPRDRADQFMLPLPGIHSRHNTRDSSIPRNAELLTNRRTAI